MTEIRYRKVEEIITEGFFRKNVRVCLTYRVEDSINVVFYYSDVAEDWHKLLNKVFEFLEIPEKVSLKENEISFKELVFPKTLDEIFSAEFLRNKKFVKFGEGKQKIKLIFENRDAALKFACKAKEVMEFFELYETAKSVLVIENIVQYTIED